MFRQGHGMGITKQVFGRPSPLQKSIGWLVDGEVMHSRFERFRPKLANPPAPAHGRDRAARSRCPRTPAHTPTWLACATGGGPRLIVGPLTALMAIRALQSARSRGALVDLFVFLLYYTVRTAARAPLGLRRRAARLAATRFVPEPRPNHGVPALHDCQRSACCANAC